MDKATNTLLEQLQLHHADVTLNEVTPVATSVLPNCVSEH
jgi:hypothetical protein